MSPALQAHQRLLAQIPRERMHTHEAKFDDTNHHMTGRPLGDLPAIRRARIARLITEINPATGKKWSNRGISALLEISTTAVCKHRRALRGEGYRPKKSSLRRPRRQPKRLFNRAKRARR